MSNEVDITAVRAEYQKLNAEMHRLEIIKKSALNSGRAFVPGTQEFTAFRYATGEQAKIREPLENLRRIIAQYDSAH